MSIFEEYGAFKGLLNSTQGSPRDPHLKNKKKSEG